MVMKPAPSPPFVVIDPDFLLEILVIALNSPAQFGQVDQAFEGDILGKIG